MRLQLMSAGAGLFGLLLVFASACGGGDDGAAAPIVPDGGGVRPPTIGDPPPPTGTEDGGLASSTGGLSYTPERLVDGVALLFGTTADDHLIVVRGGATFSIAAVSLTAPDDPIVIQDDIDVDAIGTMFIDGGAVFWWTDLNAQDVGTLHVWTKAGGTKTLNAASPLGFFAGSPDGSRIAYLSDATVNANVLESADVVIGDVADLTPTTPGLFAGNRANLASTDCFPQVVVRPQFAMTTFCTGVATTEANAQMHVVLAGTTTPFRVDDVGTAAGPVESGRFFINEAGTKIATAAPGAPGTPTTGRIIELGTDAATTTSHVVESGILQFAGYLDAAGSSMVYLTSAGIRRASTSATPAPITLVPGAKSIQSVARDYSRVAFTTFDTSLNGLIDLSAADTSTANQAGVTIVPERTANFIGLTGSAGAHFMWLEDLSAEETQIASMPSTGGDKRSLIPGVIIAGVAPQNDGAAIGVLPVANDQLTFYSLRYVDATGESTGYISRAVPTLDPQSGFMFHKKNLIFSHRLEGEAGIYRITLP